MEVCIMPLCSLGNTQRQKWFQSDQRKEQPFTNVLCLDPRFSLEELKCFRPNKNVYVWPMVCTVYFNRKGLIGLLGAAVYLLCVLIYCLVLVSPVKTVVQLLLTAVMKVRVVVKWTDGCSQTWYICCEFSWFLVKAINIYMKYADIPSHHMIIKLFNSSIECDHEGH